MCLSYEACPGLIETEQPDLVPMLAASPATRDARLARSSHLARHRKGGNRSRESWRSRETASAPAIQQSALIDDQHLSRADPSSPSSPMGL